MDQLVKDRVQSDLEVIVHAYDFRMTYEETFDYIEKEIIPLRMAEYDTELRDYALFCNSLRYVQRAQKKDGYPKAPKAKDENELFSLLMERGIFVDLLSDKEVCDMTVAQFSREDIIKSQGREEGTAEGFRLKLIEQVCKKIQKGKNIEEIAESLEESKETIEKIYKVALKYHANVEDKEKIYKELY